MAHFKNLDYTSKKALLVFALYFAFITGLGLLVGIPIFFTLGLATILSLPVYFVCLISISRHKPSFERLIFHGKADTFLKEKQKPDFKFILASFTNFHADETCSTINQSPQSQQILKYLEKLSSDQKVQILTAPAFRKDPKFPVFRYLLWQHDNMPIFRALFKDLSSKQRLDILLCGEYLCFAASDKINPELLDVVFEGMTKEDRCLLLSHKRKQYTLGLTDYLYLLIRDKITTQHLLKILVKDIPVAQLKPLLAHKTRLNLGQMQHYEVKEPQCSAGYTALDIVMLDKDAANIANLLIECGALEADLDCDFEILSKNPDINLTPYRNKIKAELKSADIFKNIKMDGVEDIICDYLTGKTPSKKNQ